MGNLSVSRGSSVNSNNSASSRISNGLRLSLSSNGTHGGSSSFSHSDESQYNLYCINIRAFNRHW